MSYEESIIKELLNELDRSENQKPGKFVSFASLVAFAEDHDFQEFEAKSVGVDDLEVEHAVSQMVDRDWAESNGNGFGLQEQSFRITAKGQLRVAADVDYAAIFSKVVSELPMAPDHLTDHKSEVEPNVPDVAINNAVSDSNLTHHLQHVHSSSWTGKQFVLVDLAIISELKRSALLLQATVQEMHFKSNSDSHNLKGLTDALVAVCSMAEPEVTIIDRILASPKFQTYAGLAALIATIRGMLGI